MKDSARRGWEGSPDFANKDIAPNGRRLRKKWVIVFWYIFVLFLWTLKQIGNGIETFTMCNNDFSYAGS